MADPFVQASPAFVAELRAAMARARAAWPGVLLSDEAFVEGLGARVKDASLEALHALHVEDVYLAFACAAGDAHAVAELDRVFVPEIRSTLSRMGLAPSVRDETLQVMREELFVGARPAIANYTGRGQLRRWLRAVAARTGLRVARQGAGHAELHESTPDLGREDMEITFLKRKYGGTFREAFTEALGNMEAKERLLLKQRFRHHLSIEDLGALHGVHASTVSRWVSDARLRLVTATRERMMERLKIGRAEVSSILRLIQSELEVTLSTGVADGVA
jgi:RNA polymerase sigma-70 factor (ECF subfamily)